MSKRPLTNEEHAAWKEETKRDKKRMAEKRAMIPSENKPTKKSKVGAPQIAVQVLMKPASRALPDKTPEPMSRQAARKLTRGDTAIDATLDLHGMTQDEAHRLLHRRMAHWVEQGMRVVCIITGKGRGGEGVLKREVPRWLNEPKLRTYISSLSPAPQRLGGDGALLVFLKRVR